jgi:hypothetical protein
MKPRSFSSRSRAAQTMWTCGKVECALGRGDEADERHRPCAGVHDLLDRGDARVPGRQHRVEDDRVALAEVVRELHVVLDRLERVLVAVHADEADPGARDQRQRALEHAHARAEHWADRDLLAGDALRAHHLERGLDLDRVGREVLRRLVGEEQRQLVDELAEMDGRRVLVPQVRELVLDERVRDDRETRLRHET